jgi:hypothetical protein
MRIIVNPTRTHKARRYCLFGCCIMAGSFAIRQSKTILPRFYGSLNSPVSSCVSITLPASS